MLSETGCQFSKSEVAPGLQINILRAASMVRRAVTTFWPNMKKRLTTKAYRPRGIELIGTRDRPNPTAKHRIAQVPLPYPACRTFLKVGATSNRYASLLARTTQDSDTDDYD